MAMRPFAPFKQDFYARAPFRVVTQTTISASAEQCFATLKAGELWPKWVAAVQCVEWTSDRPLRRNATRTVFMKNGVQIDERFIVWDENERMGFCVTESTLGAIERFGELYELQPTDDGCHIRWTFAVQMKRWWQRWLLLLLWPLMYLALRSVLNRYAYVVQKHGERALESARQEQRTLERITRETAADVLSNEPLI